MSQAYIYIYHCKVLTDNVCVFLWFWVTVLLLKTDFKLTDVTCVKVITTTTLCRQSRHVYVPTLCRRHNGTARHDSLTSTNSVSSRDRPVTSLRHVTETRTETKTRHLFTSLIHVFSPSELCPVIIHVNSKTRKPSCSWQTRATLEIRVTCHSRASKVTPFDSLHVVSYYRNTVL